ncbi:MAG: hypothetical protein BGO29_00725 [Bacteroidales bacterium 36-12]|nr:MAG: hypothetical protein BGO29_00725 [Bacteroidales bacterium 36-12]
MRTLILLLSLTLFSTHLLAADGPELLIDVNFTRDADFWFKGNTPANVSYTNETFAGGYVLTGQLSVLTESQRRQNVDDEYETFLYAHRVSRNATNQIVLPLIESVGRIRIQLYNYHASDTALIPVQYNAAGAGEAPLWTNFDPEFNLMIPHNYSTDNAYVIDTVLNIGEKQLRLAPTKNLNPANNGPNMMIFSIKIWEAWFSGTLNPEMDNIKYSINNRKLHIQSSELYHATVYNMIGNELGKITAQQTFEFKDAGHYLLRIETPMGSAVRKVVVF